jgi:2-oxoisovalerate dehydrogenase E1 component
MDATYRKLRYAYMRLAREFDARFELLLRTGRISKWYSAIGNEGITVPAGLALEPGDVLVSLHRDVGAILAYYLDPARTFPSLASGPPDTRKPDPEELLYRLACQVLGKADGFSRGIERSYHYGYFAPEAGILHVGMISHLGAMIPVAAGCAFALKERGTDRIAINFIGEGGTSTGDFHEGLNLAAVWKLPLVLIIENNHYAFSTPARNQYACLQLSDRGPGYGIPAETVDGNDPEAMARALSAAVARARTGKGPTLIEAMVGRLRGHAEGDGSMKVVPEEELQLYRAQDAVPSYGARLEAEGVLSSLEREEIARRCRQLIETAVEKALEAPWSPPEVALRPVFAPGPSEPLVPERPRLKRRLRVGEEEDPTVLSSRAAQDEEETTPMAAFTGEPSSSVGQGETTYLEAIRAALLEALEENPRVVLLGQDIGAFEGAFRVTRGLYARFPDRVLDTPISESGTLGLAAGAALLAYIPVVEMQFADFVSCGFNQIVNVIAKLFYRFERPCPVVVRLPCGGGVGAGAFHSQNPEAWFTHVAGLKVVAPATAPDAKGLMLAAIADGNPVLFLEHKFLYRRVKGVVPKRGGAVPIGEAQVLREGRDLTVIAYGAMTWTALEAAERVAKEGLSLEVVDLRSLIPLDEATVLASVQKTNRVLIVHEAQLTGGFGAEVAARLAEQAFPFLDAPIRRLAYPDRPVPYARNLESVLLPDAEKVAVAARELMAY